ncbi:MAG: hypothetical protein LBK13_06195 [Spirochaetales bacterium]|nr:hypothetical protein [Spirochaetales bacterium]
MSDKENGSKGSNMPAEDLEQYGVWVKAGPETVKEESSAGEDFELPDISDAGTEITAEEELLLGSLEENSRKKDSEGEEPLDGMDDLSLDEPAPGNADDDFSFPDIEDIRSEAGAESDAGAASGDDLFLPEEEALDDGASVETEGEKLDLDFDLDEPQGDEQAPVADDFNDIAAVEKEMTGPEPAEDALGEEPEAGMAEAGHGESAVEESALEEPSLEEPAIESALEEPAIDEPDESIIDEPAIEIENEIEEPPAGEPAFEEIEEEPESAAARAPEEEVPEGDALGLADMADTTETEEPALEDEAAAETGVVEEEPEPAAVKAGPAPVQEHPAESGILSKIEEELASIKSELLELKKELAGLRVAGTGLPESAVAEHHKTPGADSGFFAGDEDEDETIALTGDELDNILSTADITEETGESDVPDDILNFNADMHPSGSQATAAVESPDDLSLDFAESATVPESPAGEEDLGFEDTSISGADSSDAGVSIEEPLAGEDEEIPAGAEGDISFEDVDLSDTEISDADISIEEPEPEAAVPGQELELGEIPEVGQEIEADIADSGIEEPAEDFRKVSDIASDEAPAVTENIPLTTPEEQAIIEEYNRELDNFGSEDLHAEDGISETISAEAEIPAGEEEPEIEFDLDSLQQERQEAEAEPEKTEIIEDEAAPESFEEGLAEAEAPVDEEKAAKTAAPEAKKEPSSSVDGVQISGPIREEIKSVLKYMDQLLESLPEDKIQEFAHSEHFDIYRRLFEELELE